MPQLRQLRIFLAAAQTLSFTRAAERVHLSQPSVTEQIRALERSLGQVLFVRRNNTLALTAAGETLVARARGLIGMADDTFRAVRDGFDERAGTIRVAAPQTLSACLLVPLLAAHVESHPGTRVVIQTLNSSATAQAVRDGTADLGVVHGWPANDAGLQVELVARDMPQIVLPVGHPLGQAAEVTPAALAAFPLLVTMEGCRYRQYLETLLQEAPEPPRIRGVADSVPALMRMVAAGMGVSVLPGMAVDAAIMAGVERRALATAGTGLPICLLTPDGASAPCQEAFADRVRQAVSHEPVATVDVQHGAGRIPVA